ncbi:MAG TPA: hypothetical protein DCG75_11525 [Bacteroidales bacterium]|nr:hypothetical protein [Bacteroidales bacterium]
MTKNLILLALCLLYYSAISQNTKVYSGDYRLSSMDAIGTAKYSYYDNETYQRIYHGDFTLSVSKSYLTSCVITGKFKNDLRDGKWVIKGSMGYPYNFDFISNLNYLNGQPNGIWSTTVTKNGKIIQSDKRTLSNGLLIDTYEFSDSDKKSKMLIKLDKDGVFMESEMIQNAEIQSISKFKAGYRILRVEKNIQTGESTINDVPGEKTLEILTKIEYYSKNFPDSLQDLPYKLEKSSVIGAWGDYLDVPYLHTFTKDIRGAVLYDGHQCFGLYETKLVAQKTREQLRIEEENRIAEQKAEEERKIAEQKAEEERWIAAQKAEQKKQRLLYEKSKIIDIKTFDNALYQTILNELNANCSLFLKDLILNQYQKDIHFSFSVVFTWFPKEEKAMQSTYPDQPNLLPATLAKNVTPYLYYQTKYIFDKVSSGIKNEIEIPDSFDKVFEINKLANIEKVFEGEKFKMILITSCEGIKIDYDEFLLEGIKVSKEKEITWEEGFPDNMKKILEEKIKQLEKGKYTLRCFIAKLNESVVDVKFIILK